MNEQMLRYSMLIEWSDEDQAYLVTLPEWAGRVIMPVTHGIPIARPFNMGKRFSQCWWRVPRKRVNNSLCQKFMPLKLAQGIG